MEKKRKKMLFSNVTQVLLWLSESPLIRNASIEVHENMHLGKIN